MNGIDYVGAGALDMFRSMLGARLPHGDRLPFGKIARDFLQIRTLDNRVIPFLLRPIQKRYLATKRLALMRGRRPRFLLLKYRRGGYTTVEQGLSYYMASRRRNVNVLTLAQDIDTTAKIFRIARLMHERDPKAPPIKGTGNQYKLEFPGLNSIFYIGTAGARSVARGETLSRIHWSEVAWSCRGVNQYTKQREILAGITEAASGGEVVLETTPRGSEYFRDLYMGAKAGKNDWTPIFLRWHEDPINSVPLNGVEEHHAIMEALDDEEQRLVETKAVTSANIKWRRLKKREISDLYYQEYPDDDETCWLTSGTSFFDPSVLLKIRDYCMSPPLVDNGFGAVAPEGSRHLPGGYEVVWEHPQEDVDYCMGVDTSEGLPGRDPNGLGVMRRDNGKQVCAVHGLFGVRVLAEHVCRIARRYNDALVGVERENHGHAVISKIIDLGYDKPHHSGGSFYYHSLQNSSMIDDRPVTRAGWSTNSITRPVMLEDLRDWLEADGAIDRCMDRQFLSECLVFRLQEDGKFSADSGSHDDAVMKWAIANAMRTVDWRRSRVGVVMNRWQ